MHPRYAESANLLSAWAEREPCAHAVIVLGSQARDEFAGDEWSDLDVLLLVDRPLEFIQDSAWPAFLGEIACATVEETQLAWLNLTWTVKRVLFTDHRAIDFSIMPYERIYDVLSMNAEIHVNGYQVIYDDHTNWVECVIETTLALSKT